MPAAVLTHLLRVLAPALPCCLCNRYHDMLKKAREEGSVTHVTTLWDSFFEGGRDHRYDKPSVTHIPYLEGDYWPGEAENLLTQIQDGQRSAVTGVCVCVWAPCCAAAAAQAQGPCWGASMGHLLLEAWSLAAPATLLAPEPCSVGAARTLLTGWCKRLLRGSIVCCCSCCRRQHGTVAQGWWQQGQALRRRACDHRRGAAVAVGRDPGGQHEGGLHGRAPAGDVQLLQDARARQRAAQVSFT